jgi:hypothetical protein
MKKWCIIVLLLLSDASVNAAEVKLPIPGNLQVLSRQWRIDMHWDEPLQWSANEDWWYEVERSVSPDGPFEKCHEGYLGYPGYSDFLGEADKTYYYRVRTIWLIKERPEEKARIEQVSPDVLYVSKLRSIWQGPLAGQSLLPGLHKNLIKRSFCSRFRKPVSDTSGILPIRSQAFLACSIPAGAVRSVQPLRSEWACSILVSALNAAGSPAKKQPNVC